MPVTRKKILIVGLGNPGKKYEYTRHNFGYRVLDQLRNELGLSAFRPSEKLASEVSEGNVDNINIILARPQTFMNNSGEAVRALKKKYSLTPVKFGSFMMIRI